jgi:hypothetical protein
MLHYFKGLQAPTVSALKKYQILSCNLLKGISYSTQDEKILKNRRVGTRIGIACGSRMPSCSLQKGLQLPLELLQ